MCDSALMNLHFGLNQVTHGSPSLEPIGMESFVPIISHSLTPYTEKRGLGGGRWSKVCVNAVYNLEGPKWQGLGKGTF